MSVEIFLMILGAALMHATWNALVKSDGDRLGVIKMMMLSQCGLSVCAAPFVAVPAPESWPYLLASAGLNIGYMVFLNWAYRVGDLSHVYPFARGIAPMLVAIVSVGFLGEYLSQFGQVAVALITLGIISLGLTRSATGSRDPRPVLLALVTGCFIAAFTVCDALGARAAGTPHGYMVWLSLIWGSLMAGGLHLLLHHRGVHRGTYIEERVRRVGMVAGVMSYAATWLVIWALTLAPMALVSALRETSIVFAIIIGVVFLRERLSLQRLASIMTTLIGMAALKLSR